MALAVLGAGGAAWAATRSSTDGVTSVLATAASGTMRQTVSATGTIAPKQEADLNFAVDGEVTAVAATVGAKVTKGDVLARVDRKDRIPGSSWLQPGTRYTSHRSVCTQSYVEP